MHPSTFFFHALRGSHESQYPFCLARPKSVVQDTLRGSVTLSSFRCPPPPPSGPDVCQQLAAHVHKQQELSLKTLQQLYTIQQQRRQTGNSRGGQLCLSVGRVKPGTTVPPLTMLEDKQTATRQLHPNLLLLLLPCFMHVRENVYSHPLHTQLNTTFNIRTHPASIYPSTHPPTHYLYVKGVLLLPQLVHLSLKLEHILQHRLLLLL